MAHKMDDVTFEAMKAQLEAFEKKFGRKPGPNDPFFFDPDLDVPVQLAPQKVTDELVIQLSEAGMQPAVIWVYIKTGLLRTKDNEKFMTDEENRNCDDALRDFRDNCPDLATHIKAAKARLASNSYYETIQ